MVTPKVCVVKETLPTVVSGQDEELDELSQVQMDDDELGDSHIPKAPELQKYAPVWTQLQVHGSRLVGILIVHTVAASQVQTVLSRSMVSSVL